MLVLYTVSCWCQFFIHIIMLNVSAKIFIQMKMPPAKKKVKITNSRWKGGDGIERELHPRKPNHFETAANATLEAPMHIMRHSSTRYAVTSTTIMCPFPYRPFIHKLQFSVKAMHYFVQERASLQNLLSSPRNMQRSFL